MNRHRSREQAMKIIYAWQFKENVSLSDFARTEMKRLKKRRIDPEYIKRDILGIEKNLKKIDKLITKAAPEWPLEQIAYIDLSILRLATFELIFRKDIPPKVVIDEAVELAKKFGGENASKFINGVLGTIFRSSKRYDPKHDQ